MENSFALNGIGFSNKKGININKINPENIVLFFGILAHVIVFVAFFFIGGVHCDEAMTALNARSLADFSTDISGERLPVYFDTWLYGGQSPMATYVAAAFIKLFGYSLFTLRLPMLLVSIGGLFAAKEFLKIVFDDEKTRLTILTLLCFSPWHLFSGAYMLDCNFLPHFLMAGGACLAKAVKEEKGLRYYALAMIFFGLGFYCYIASVLVIPLFLAVFYIVLIKDKKISVKEFFVSVGVLVLVSLSFILFGLVTVGVIEPFNFLGFSYSEMPNYGREATLNIFSGGSLTEKTENLLSTIFFTSSLLAFPDLTFKTYGLNIFQYTNLFGGIATVVGMLVFAVGLFHKKENSNIIKKAFGISAFIVTLFYLAMTKMNMASAYRFGALEYFLVFFEGLGFLQLYSFFKKFDYKKFLALFTVASLCLFSCGFFYELPKDLSRSAHIYNNNLCDAIEFANSKGYDEYYFCLDLTNPKKSFLNERYSVFFRHYYYDQSDFIPLDEELESIGAVNIFNKTDIKPVQPMKNGFLHYKFFDENDSLTEPGCYMFINEYKGVEIDTTGYNVKKFGGITVAYK